MGDPTPSFKLNNKTGRSKTRAKMVVNWLQLRPHVQTPLLCSGSSQGMPSQGSIPPISSRANTLHHCPKRSSHAPAGHHPKQRSTSSSRAQSTTPHDAKPSTRVERSTCSASSSRARFSASRPSASSKTHKRVRNRETSTGTQAEQRAALMHSSPWLSLYRPGGCHVHHPIHTPSHHTPAG